MLEDFIKSESEAQWPGHVYLLCGQVSQIKEQLEIFFKNGKFEVFAKNYSTFGIEDAQYISRLTFLSSDKIKVFIMGVYKFTNEAQNAFLKTLEEPRGSSLFFLVTENESLVLPTLKSRCQVHNFRERETLIDSNQFIKASIGDRIKMITDMIEKTEEEDHRIKQKEEVSALLDDLENTFKKDWNKSQALEDIYMVRKYLNDPSASFKLLLEHLAVVL